jgi:hypothetical protein
MYFGYALSGAGDVNGDGVSDIVVGADGMSSGETEEGIVFIYHGVQGQGIPATAATALQQNKERANFGRVVAGVGDTNGDGYSDIVIGAGPNAMDDEQVSLYRGGGGGVLPTPFRYYRPSVAPPAGIGTSFGESISGAGDIDGDGLADFVVGEPWYSNGQDGEGAIHVFYGIASNSPSLEIREVRESNQVRAHYGFQVSGAGDVNADGYSDVAVSAWGWSSPEPNEGAVFVHRGSPSTAIAGGGITAGDTQDLFGSSLDVGDITGDGLDDLIVGAPGADRAYVAVGPLWATPVWNKQGQAGSGFGRSAAIVGDVNGDGNEDVLVGAPLYTNGQAQEGRVELYLGGPGGPGSSPVWSYEPNLASIQLGKSVATGDVNGDGYPDVVIGAPGYDNGSSTDVGAAFVFFGNGTGLATSPSVTLLGEQSFAGFGNAVATANVNGDAYSDIAVSAPFFTADQTREGVVFIYHGTATGPSTAFTKRLEGTTADAEFGSAIASAGDINRDGRGDFIVGSPRYSNGQPNEGRMSFYLGSATGLNSALQHLESDLAGALYGASLAGVGDIDGDYRSDVSIGAPGHSSGAGAVYRYKGSSLGDLAPLSTEVSNTSIKGFGSAISRGGDANGDGFPDYSIGAPLATFNGQINQGVVAHRGGNGTFFDGTGAVSLRVKQRRLSTTSLLPPRSRSDSATAFEVAVLSARTPVGRTRVKLEVEAKSLGTVFNGSGLVSSSWFDTGVSGPALPLQVTRPAGDSTHWRARLVYDTARIGPWHQPRSRWYHGGDPREPQGVHVRIP